jgi:PAS domain S-box-containing protein
MTSPLAQTARILSGPGFASHGSAIDSQLCFTQLLRSVNLIAVMLDPDARIIYCNDYFLRLTGWSFAEIDGRKWHEVFMSPSSDDLSLIYPELFAELPSTWQDENAIFTRSAERRRVRWNNILLRDARGTPIAVGGIGEDITDRRQLERSLNDCAARERGTLEKDLHDGLGQELAGIALLSRSLATSASRDNLSIAGELARLSLIASKAIESCRHIARALSPFSDFQGGLVHAIRQLAQMPPDWHGPTLEFEVQQKAPVMLSTEAADHVYRLAQEALINACKRPEVKLVRIALNIRPSVLRMEIIDDGVAPPVLSDESLAASLKMMRHRANVLEASLIIEPRAAGGTRLSLVCDQPA